MLAAIDRIRQRLETFVVVRTYLTYCPSANALTGKLLLASDPSPSWPEWFAPQQDTPPRIEDFSLVEVRS